ncbi:VapC toxin family PIN domain ribonuclease [Halobacteriales archaeon QS_5_68_33]|jgi:predicted nucleic acid-binding protein|nr:MAG: VapC toxin family PIN domain ribonuclease [Halobacteriales archaeon QH_3_68_24]PSP53060.1 MAG: VapC toxin family PIN domain ribonuclease [Halobacteriales archaeon QH_1_68_42]PSQ06024.1 MAG: VapC toxin family PIN domain ribonuclease [Halobacteriales archaeon QS_5_68_33]
MLYLDNDVLRKFARPDPDPAVVDYLSRHGSEPWGISTVVLYEFLSYYSSAGTRQKRLQTLKTDVVDDIAAFDEDAAVEAASMDSSLEDANASLDAADLMIAATARRYGGTLVTANKRDFDKRPIHQLMDVDIVDVS